MQSAGRLIKAAQYVRMSREKQVYSPINQQAAIAAYATLHGFEIIRTYTDEGRSGLRIKGRAALQEMLRDVLAGDAEYRAILVFDISRWGRFQDTDESAHYEFICRRAGVPVHYCAEMFANDGSLVSTVFKNLRRAMAGEFSRDLSAKVWAAQCRLASLGYKMGGKAGYGLHRLLIDRDGNPKQVLQEGEHKSITTDRIILVPGDPAEVATVQRIFRLAEQGLPNPDIAALLNSEGVPAPIAKKWSNVQVRQILIAERYLGTCIYNRRSAKLRSPYTLNPRSEWVRREKAFQPLISVRRFRAVQGKDRSRRPTYTDEQLLDNLRSLLSQNGYLTRGSVDTDGPPTAKTYDNRFGSMARAYALIGYDPNARDFERSSAQARVGFATEIAQLLESWGHRVVGTPTGSFLTIDERYVLATRICNRRRENERGYWRIERSNASNVDLVLAALMRGDERAHIYLVPTSRFGKSGKIDLTDGRNHMADYEVWDLSLLPDMIAWHASKRLQ